MVGVSIWALIALVLDNVVPIRTFRRPVASCEPGKDDRELRMVASTRDGFFPPPLASGPKGLPGANIIARCFGNYGWQVWTHDPDDAWQASVDIGRW